MISRWLVQRMDFLGIDLVIKAGKVLLEAKLKEEMEK